MSVRSLAKALDYSDAGGTKPRREVVGLQGKNFCCCFAFSLLLLLNLCLCFVMAFCTDHKSLNLTHMSFPFERKQF